MNVEKLIENKNYFLIFIILTILCTVILFTKVNYFSCFLPKKFKKKFIENETNNNFPNTNFNFNKTQKYKISNIYDKYLNVEGQPNFEEAARILKSDMEKDNGPTWICIIGQDFSFNVKSQKEACLYGYLGHFGVLLYKC